MSVDRHRDMGWWKLSIQSWDDIRPLRTNGCIWKIDRGQKIDFQSDIDLRVTMRPAGIQIIAAQFTQINYSMERSPISVPRHTITKTRGWACFKDISRGKLMRTDILTDGSILKPFVCPLHGSCIVLLKRGCGGRMTGQCSFLSMKSRIESN